MDACLILFGAGHDGKEAYAFFGSENVLFFVDNNRSLVGSPLFDKKICPVDDIVKFKDKCEVIICISKTRWMMFSVACQLRKLGVENFSVFQDIKKHYQSGDYFLDRNTDLYPCEQESISEIYQKQLDYMVRHTGRDRTFYYRDRLDEIMGSTPAGDLQPASGEMRRRQKWSAELFFEFLERLKKDLDINAALFAGSLLGAVRHGGFVPWDDDMDVCVLKDEYDKIVSYLLQSTDVKVYKRAYIDNRLSYKPDKYEIEDEIYSKKFFAIEGFGWITLFYNIGAKLVDFNMIIGDIIPLHYFSDDMTEDKYRHEFWKWLYSRKIDFCGTDQKYLTEIETNMLYKSGNKKIGIGMDMMSAVYYLAQHQGRGIVDCRLWNIEDYLPLTTLSFEEHKFYAPKNYKKWLEKEYGHNYMELPQRVGIYVHDKERIFHDIY